MTTLRRLMHPRSPDELVLELRRGGGWTHLTAADVEAIAAGASCGPGLVRAWVWACGGSAEDEALAWIDRGWSPDEARKLVASLPPIGPTCDHCGRPVKARRRGGAREGEGTTCSPRCRKAAQREREAERVASRVETCACCRSPLEPRRRGGARSGVRFCSAGCRASHWRTRHVTPSACAAGA